MKTTIYQLTVCDASPDNSYFTVCNQSDHKTKTEAIKAFREANRATFSGRVRVQLKSIDLHISVEDGDWAVSEGEVKILATEIHE